MAIGYIYVITASDDVVRYVGRTRLSVSERLRTHKVQARKRRTRVHVWIDDHKNQLKIRAIEETELESLPEREYFWYRHYLDLGFPLVNVAPGGNYVPDNRGRVHTPEFREMRRKLMTGTKHSAETKAKMSQSRMGKPGNSGQHARWHRDRGTINPNCHYCKEQTLDR